MRRQEPLDSEAYYGRRDDRALLVIVVIAMLIPQVAGWLALLPTITGWLTGSLEPGQGPDYSRDRGNVASIAPLSADIIPAARRDRALLGQDDNGSLPP